MKRFLLLCLTTLLSVAIWAFNATNDEGITLVYDIVSSDDYEYACEVSTYIDTKPTEIIVPSEVENSGHTYTVIGIGECAFTGGDMESVQLPNTITYIGKHAFESCHSLTSMTIPNSVKYIYSSAFESCPSITTVTLGSSLEFIDEFAFTSEVLLEVYSLNPTPPQAEECCFNDATLDDGILYVPLGSRQAYQDAPVWEEFMNIVEIGTSPPTVTTLSATDIGQTTVTLNATIIQGTETIEEQGFEYWVSGNVVQTIIVTDISGEEMSVTLEGLETSTTYNYCAYAKTTSGTYYGENSSFTTQSNYDCYVDGFYLRIISTSRKTCAVTCLSPTSLNEDVYQGEIIIPTSVEIDGDTYTVTGIDEYAFCYCSNLISVEIPTTITSMGYAAFYNCTSLVKADIPTSVTSLGACMYYNCYKLKEVAIPSGFTGIPSYFCYNCSSLTEVVISDNVKDIYDCAFCYCTGVNTITIGNSVQSIGWHAFDSCNMKSVIIPNSVTGIGYYAFAHCPSLETVTMGTSVETIQGYAFAYSNSLISIQLPESLTDVGDGMFQGCTSLVKVDIKCQSVSKYMFLNCSSLKDVTIGNSITSLGDRAFYDCTSLETIEIPNSVTSIDFGAFMYCSILKEVDFGNSVTSIGTYAFYGCSSLEEVLIPNSVTSIDFGAFMYCSILKEVDFGNSATSIGTYAFYGCSSLKEVDFGNSVTNIGSYAFYNCSSLEEVLIPNSVTSIGESAFYNCSSLEEVLIPNSVTNIGSYAFRNCTSLEEIEISNSVLSIEFGVFYACTSLTKALIGSAVSSLGYSSFGNCPTLSTLYSLNPEPPTCGYANSGSLSPFDDVNHQGDVDKSTCILYVPSGSYEAYSTASTWKEFINIIEMTDLTIVTYDVTDVTEFSAVLSGTLTVGTLPIKEKGFEFWSDENNIVKIIVDGDELTAEISELEPNTMYTCHAYATTASGTLYGEDVQFMTLEDTTGIDMLRIGGINYENVEGIYSTSGQKLNTTVQGVNIVLYNDGTVKKIYVK